MSLENKRLRKCAKCGEVYEVTIYDSVSVTLDPDLREKVINGDLFTFECPHCHNVEFLN